MPKITRKRCLISVILIVLGFGIHRIMTPAKPVEPSVYMITQSYDDHTAIWGEKVMYPVKIPNVNWSSSFRKGGFDGGMLDGGDRAIPEWIEFFWKETPIVENDPRPVEERIRVIDNAPLKQQRVLVASRIPAVVIQEAIEAVIHREKGKVPNKTIYMYFTWYKGHVYFSWDLTRDGPIGSTAGGDRCKNGRPIPMQSKEPCF